MVAESVEADRVAVAAQGEAAEPEMVGTADPEPAVVEPAVVEPAVVEPEVEAADPKVDAVAAAKRMAVAELRRGPAED